MSICIHPLWHTGEKKRKTLKGSWKQSSRSVFLWRTAVAFLGTSKSHTLSNNNIRDEVNLTSTCFKDQLFHKHTPEVGYTHTHKLTSSSSVNQALFSAADRSCFQSNDKFPRVVYSGKAIMNFILSLKVVSFAITFNTTFLLQFKVWQVSIFPDVPAKIQITISAHQKSWTKPIHQL